MTFAATTRGLIIIYIHIYIIIINFITGLKIIYKGGNDIFKDLIFFFFSPPLTTKPFQDYSALHPPFLSVHVSCCPDSVVPHCFSLRCTLGRNERALLPPVLRSPVSLWRRGSPSKQPELKALNLFPSLTFFGIFSLTTRTWQTSYFMLFKWNVTVIHIIVKYYFQYFSLCPRFIRKLSKIILRK